MKAVILFFEESLVSAGCRATLLLHMASILVKSQDVQAMFGIDEFERLESK
jgi:hypothetical protein